MLDNKLLVTLRQFKSFLCAGGMRNSKTRDQPQAKGLTTKIYQKRLTGQLMR